VGDHGCFNTQARARDTPIALVAVTGRWLILALLASGLGSSVGAPSAADPLSADPLIWYPVPQFIKLYRA
jgi:hypothetical protein